jgi:hypothetical protein
MVAADQPSIASSVVISGRRATMSPSGTTSNSPAANPTWVAVTTMPAADWPVDRSCAIVCTSGCA